jgi:hypothetical protein
VQWQSDGGANPIICDHSTPAATSSTYSGSDTRKFRTFNNLQTRVVFVDIQSPSSPSITNTTPQFTNQAVSFSFSSSGFSDPTFGRFECRVTPTIQTSFQLCSSGVSFNPTTDGTYNFEVRSVDRAGNRSPMASRQSTISNAPRVDSGTLFPAKGATAVLRNANVQATFTEAMYPDSLRDPFNSTSKTFKLQMYNKKTGNWKAIPATVTLSNVDKTATLNPYGDATTLLGANKKFKATIPTGAKEASGNPMASNFVWTFKTGRR